MARSPKPRDVATFAKVPSALLGSVSMDAVAVFAALAHHAKRAAPHTCYPRQDTLAAMCPKRTKAGLVPCCVKTVQRSLKELERVGWIRINRRRNKNNRYELFFDRPRPPAVERTGPESDSHVATGDDSPVPLVTTPESYKPEVLEPVLTTGLVGKQLDALLFEVVPMCTRKREHADKVRRDFTSAVNIFDAESAHTALDQLKGRKLKPQDFRDELFKLCQQIAPAPF